MTKLNKNKGAKNLHWFYDWGHGWLRVPLGYIGQLEIADQITGCSMIRGKYAYLEEDLDAGLFFRTMKERAFSLPEKIPYTDAEGSSKLRTYPDFTMELYAVATADPFNGPVFGNAPDDVPLECTVIHMPFVHIPSGFIWLISETCRSNPDLAFCWARLHKEEFVEWGTVNLAELRDIGAVGIPGWAPLPFKYARPVVEVWQKCATKELMEKASVANSVCRN